MLLLEAGVEEGEEEAGGEEDEEYSSEIVSVGSGIDDFRRLFGTLL